MERRRLLVRKDQTDVHIICNISVTSTTSNTYLVNSSGSGIIDKFSAMWIDGVKLAEPVVSYKFSTKGNHEVKYSVADDVVFDSKEFQYVISNSIRITSKFTTPITTNPWTRCNNVESIIADDGNLIYDSRNNCNAIIETATNKLVTGCKNTVIPNTVTIIGEDAFYLISSITSITIPNSVTIIENGAFSSITRLSSVTIPNSVTTIGERAFGFCSIRYTNVVLPSSVTNIGINPWSGCSELESITVNSNNTVFDSRNNCNAIVRKSDNTLITGCKNTVIPSTVKIIGEDAFRHINGLGDFVIPSGVTSIGGLAFNGTDLTSIDIPSTVKSIGQSCFSLCNSLSSVTVRRTTPPTLGSGAFSSTPSTMKIYVPSASVNTYKTASGWSSYASKIEAIS